MKREIFIKVIVDWENYDDVCDETLIEDTGIYDALKDGVKIEIVAPESEKSK